MPEIGIFRNYFPKGKPVDQVHEFVDRGRCRFTVDHRHRLGCGSPENGRNGAPVRGTSPWLRKKGEGTAVILTGCKRGAAEGRTRPGNGGEQSAEEALSGVNVADSGASK
jgi:hypothetical protein